MSYTYDFNSADPGVQIVAHIRLNTFRNLDRGNIMFQDEELLALYTQERSSIKRASARVLEIVASQENYIQKAIKLLALSTNGPSVAAEFRAQAQELRSQADVEESLANGGSFDFAPLVVDDFTYRQRILDTLL